LAWKKMIRQ
jgi:hypothetical protein